VRPTTAHRSVVITVGLLLLAGCVTPVGVVRVDPRDAHRTLTSSVLTSGDLSAATQIVLQEEGLARTFDEEPETALARLHAGLVSGRRGMKVLFPLAELAFRRAQDTGSREWYLAAALYAWAFLFPDDPRDEAGRLDRRVRMAADFYNIALAEAFRPDEGSAFVPRSRVFTLPFGDVEVRFDESTLHWRGRDLVDLVPLTEFEVRGLRARYRHDGIGTPLAASLRTTEPDRLKYDLVAPGAKSPVTALLTFPRPLRQIRDGRVHGILKLHVARLESESADVVVDDRRVPLELDQTAVAAYGLNDAKVWDRELGGFFRSLVPNPGARTQLGATGPYRPGLIPVVFVHGTASSPARWAEMYNRLVNSSRLHGRVQFWYFMYDTGAPIPYSAGLLRNALTEAVAELDPEGRDPALKRMVLIGTARAACW
jgi:hypothetical protein